MPSIRPKGRLRRGWSTGACACAAACSAFEALTHGRFADPVSIHLPRGERPSFALAHRESGPGWARAGVIKDAGDDPDVTHGAEIRATVEYGRTGDGIVFRAGPGVGRVTLPGLPLAVGEPAINPGPRAIIAANLNALAERLGVAADLTVTVSVPEGERLAAQTHNPRLGIVGGLSILGTTGVVVPYSSAAWVQSIHRAIDVARAAGHDHLALCTGATSETAVKADCGLADLAVLSIGGFAAASFKYLRRHGVGRLTVAGGFAKLAKLAAGAGDLHSSRSPIAKAWLIEALAGLGAEAAVLEAARRSTTANHILELAEAAKLPLAQRVAEGAHAVVRAQLPERTALAVRVVDRQGRIVGRA